MRAHNRLHRADVIAVFENLDDADEAVLQLRLAGFRDSQIGYFSQQPDGRLMDLLDHDREFAGSIIGGIVGALVGVGVARWLNDWFASVEGATDFFGLAVTLATFGALFLGFVGWWIGTGIARSAVEAPAIGPNVGAYILAVEAGEGREKVWTTIRAYGGHELPPGALMAEPTAV